VERSLDAGPVVLCEGTYTVDGVLDIFTRDGLIRKVERTAREVRLGLAAQIQHNLDQVLEIRLPSKGILEGWRHNAEQEIEVVCDFLAWQFRCSPSPVDLLPCDHAR